MRLFRPYIVTFICFSIQRLKTQRSDVCVIIILDTKESMLMQRASEYTSKFRIAENQKSALSPPPSKRATRFLQTHQERYSPSLPFILQCIQNSHSFYHALLYSGSHMLHQGDNETTMMYSWVQKTHTTHTKTQ